jgi:HEPN domain-containing protein
MNNKNINELVIYWKKSAEHDYKTMLGLFRIKRFSDCLFYGHIVLEKILKAHVVKNTKKDAPRSHNLLYLAKIADLEIDKKTRDFLVVVNRFNMRTRYPDFKFDFYKICNLSYTRDNIKEIKKLYKKLCQDLKLKK